MQYGKYRVLRRACAKKSAVAYTIDPRVLSRRDEAAAKVRQLIQLRAPLVWRDRELLDGVALGRDGLGLDSIAIVELMLACEAALGIPFPATLFDTGPITVGRLIAHAREQSNGGG
jgi:acyl carrier protein